MPFKWVTKKCVESDAGFVVEFIGLHTLAYREAGRTLTLPVEGGALENGLRNVHVTPSAFGQWDDAASKQSFSDDERVEIIERVSQACLFQGLKLVVQDTAALSLSDLQELSPKFRDGGSF